MTESITAADSSVIVHPDCASWWQAFLAAATDAPNPDHARLIAFTNNAVSRYNAHARAYFRGADASPFVADELVVTHGGVYSLDDVKKSPFKAEPMYGTSREIVIASAKPMMLLLDGAAKCGDVREYINGVGERDATRFARKYEFRAWEITTAVDEQTFYTLDPSHRNWHKQWLDWLSQQKHWHDFWLLQRSFATLQPHWSLTIHKSQGSQFRHVFIDLANIEGCHKTDLDQKRALLYTGVTRAQSTVHVVADQPAMDLGWL